MMCSPLGGDLPSAAVVFTFIVPAVFYHPKTYTHVRLLGPCFKTDRMKFYDWQQPWNNCGVHHGCKQTGKGEDSPKEHVPQQLCWNSTSWNASWKQLPSGRTYHSVSIAVDAHCWEMWQLWSEDMHRWSIGIGTMPVTKQNSMRFPFNGFTYY